MTDLDLRSIPGYIVHERLDADLVSAMYLAERESDGYPVVLHVITEEHEDETASAFLDAHQRVGAIKHPVIPDVWDTGRVDGVLYSVTEAVEGRPLAATLEHSGRLSLDTTLSICSELADTLDTLHAADIVHGALNPHTIWINDRTRVPSAPWVTLRGFGLAPLLWQRASGDRQDPPPADLLYAAPEQIRQEEIAGRVDQYALACMVVHCLTGAPPFERATINALTGAHLFAAPGSRGGGWDALHPHIVAAVRRAMEKDPAERFALCSGLATAIGGGRQRSWTWMIEEALSTDTDDEISLLDEPTGPMDLTGIATELDVDGTWKGMSPTGSATMQGGSLADQPEVPPQPRRPASPSIPSDVAARAFAEVDWLPNSTARPASAGRRPPFEPRPTPTPRARARRAIDAPVLRWLAVICAAIVLITVAVMLATRSASTSAAEEDEAAAAPGVEELPAPPVPSVPAWQRTVARQPMTDMIATGRTLVGGNGDVITAVDPATGAPQWRATVDDEVIEVVSLEQVVIARTAGTVHAFDEDTGRELWNTTDDDLTPVAMAAGRALLHEVTVDDGGAVAVHALTPATGSVEWSIAGLATGADGTAAVYDPSRLGQQMLYVLNGTQLYAIDTAYRRLRWETTLAHPEIGSLTAVARAILVISADGQICRYGMQDGDEVWTGCATLQTAPGPRAVIHTRNARVLVRSAREIAAVDFTSGQPHWRVTDGVGFQEPFAASADTAFVVHADGSIEGIDHQRGVERWRSEPLGDVTAMTIDEDAVYAATSDGQVARFDAAQP